MNQPDTSPSGPEKETPGQADDLVHGVRLVSLKIPAYLEFVSLIRYVLTLVARRSPNFSDTKVEGLILAVSEATSNAINSYPSQAPSTKSDRLNTQAGVHTGVEGGSTRDHLTSWSWVTIEVFELSSELIVKVRDGGSGIPDKYLDQLGNSSGLGDLASERGRGLSIMTNSVDRIDVVTGEFGTTVILGLTITQ